MHKLTPNDWQEAGRHACGESALFTSLVAGAALTAAARTETMYTKRMLIDKFDENGVLP